jgi:hypothetical protein
MSDENVSVDTGTANAGTQESAHTPENTGTVESGTQVEGSSLTNQQQNQAPQSQTSDTVKTENAASPWDNDENPYRKRFNDTLSSSQKLYQEHIRLKKEYEGIDASTARKLLDQQKQQEETARLKPWNKGHQEYPKFQSIRNRVSDFRRMQQAADTPEKQAMLRDLGGQLFAPEELSQVQAYEAERQERVQQLTEDPVGFINELVQPIIRQALSEFDSFQRASTQTAQWFNDPNNQPLVDKYAPEMYKIMDPNVSARDKAIEHARLLAENDALKARLNVTSETQMSEQARNQGRQRVVGDRKPSTPAVSNYDKVVKQGFQPGTVEFATALQRLNQKG